MARDISQLEPAERDPVQLRRTGLTIAVVMIVGGIIVAFAYVGKLKKDAQSGRPPIVARLKANFGARDHNNKAFAISQLEGKRSLITPVSGKEKERIAESLRVMKMIAEKYPEDDTLRFVGITVDPENDGPEQLTQMLVDLGVGEDSRWFFVQAEEENARNYMKSQLRLATIELIKTEEGEKKRFLSQIAVVDKYLHLRRHYDFNLAREVQEDARRLIKEDTAEAERLNAEQHKNDVEAAEAHLVKTLEYIETEILEPKGAKQ